MAPYATLHPRIHYFFSLLTITLPNKQLIILVYWYIAGACPGGGPRGLGPPLEKKKKKGHQSKY